MTALKDLKEKRAANIAEMRALNDKADLNESERTRFDELETETRSIDDDISRADRLAAFERIAEQPRADPMARELRSYSVAKALLEQRAGKLTGLEAETHQELSRDRDARGVIVPTSVVLGETRALTTSAPAAGPGGNLVSTDLAAMTDRRRPALKI